MSKSFDKRQSEMESLAFHRSEEIAQQFLQPKELLA